MAQTVLLVGTRKGCFVLESDADRKDWQIRGPYCEWRGLGPLRSSSSSSSELAHATSCGWTGWRTRHA